MESFMSSLDRYEEEMCQIVWTHLLASRKAADMKKSHFLILGRSSKCCLGLWQHLSALLLFTAVPRAPGVHSEPLSHFGARIQTGTQHASQCKHPTITYCSVLLRSKHLKSKVLLCGCCSVPASWLECHTSNLGDAVKGNTAANTCWVQTGCCTRPGGAQQCVRGKLVSVLLLKSISSSCRSPMNAKLEVPVCVTVFCVLTAYVIAGLQKPNYQDFNQD